MIKNLVVICFITMACSCNNGNSGNTLTSFNYKNSSLGTLKEIYEYSLVGSNRGYDARAYFVRKHRDEVLKTLEIVEEIEVQKDVVLIFYRYSIGTDIAKKTQYMRKMDGVYVPYSKYFSSYDIDPFKNGKPEEGKALLKKAEAWDDNENIWWSY
jgi:hypothetical protein